MRDAVNERVFASIDAEFETGLLKVKGLWGASRIDRCENERAPETRK